MSSNGRVEVKKGSSVRLECKASGNPVPKITWSRKNNVLPSGDQTLVTPVLTLDRVDRHQAGVYKCTASNGVGEDVTEEINLHVLCEYGLFFILIYLYYKFLAIFFRYFKFLRCRQNVLKFRKSLQLR